MREITKKLTVDMARRSNSRLIYAVQCDKDSRRVLITLTSSGEPYIVPKELQATVNVLRPDGQSSAFAAEITDEGEILVELSLWMLSVAGETRCSVSIYDEAGRRLTSADFALDVSEAIYTDTDVVQDESYSVLAQLMSEVVDFKQSEAVREENELARVNAEKNRAESEGVRQISENARSMSEDARNTRETSRINAESLRDEDERERRNKENTRITNENARIENEILRKSAEDQRVFQEEQRVSSENSRISSENERKSAESGRVINENSRENAELSRCAAEEARVIAHNNRTSTVGLTLAESSKHYSSTNLDEVLDEIGNRIEEAEATVNEVTGPIYGKYGSITLTVSEWSDELSLTKSFSDLGDYDMITFSPITRESRDVICKADIFASVTDSSQGIVSFSAMSLPKGDISMNYFISRGRSV